MIKVPPEKHYADYLVIGESNETDIFGQLFVKDTSEIVCASSRYLKDLEITRYLSLVYLEILS